MTSTSDKRNNCICGGWYLTSNKSKHEKTTKHQEWWIKSELKPELIFDGGGFNVSKNKWFKEATTEYDVVPTYSYENLEDFFRDYKGYEKDLIVKELKIKLAFKLNRGIEVVFKKSGTDEVISYWYNKGRQQYHDIHTFNEHYIEFEQDFRQWIEDDARKGSDLIFLHIKLVSLTFAKINILMGGEYIQLLYDCTKTVLNIKTKAGSNKCSLHHILAHIYPNPDKNNQLLPFHYEALEYIVLNKDKKGWIDEMRAHIKSATTPDNIEKRLFTRVLKLIFPLLERSPNNKETQTNEEKQLQDIMKLNIGPKLENFPWSVKQFRSFERKNIDIGISIYGLERKNRAKKDSASVKLTSKDFTVVPKYHNHLAYGRKHQINLLHLEEDDQEHYCLIKDFQGFVNGTNNTKSFICPRCLHRHGSKEALDHHIVKCGKEDICQVVMPEEGKHILRFSKHVFKFPLPFVYYGDTEAYNQLFEKEKQTINCFMDPLITIQIPELSFEGSKEKSKTEIIARQDTSAFGLKCVSRYPELVKNDYISYRGHSKKDALGEMGKRFNDIEYMYGSRKYTTNELENLKIIQIRDLEIDKEYAIIEADPINAKFGKCYSIRLEKMTGELFDTFLPKRYNHMSCNDLMCSKIIKGANDSIKLIRKTEMNFYQGLLRTNIPFDGIIPDNQQKQDGDECECSHCLKKLFIGKVEADTTPKREIEETKEVEKFQLYHFNLSDDILISLTNAVKVNKTITITLPKESFSNGTSLFNIELPLNKSESRLFIKNANINKYCFSIEKIRMFKVLSDSGPKGDEKLVLNKNNFKTSDKKDSTRALLDHDHFTGKFRGWSCYDCNTAEGKATKFVPIFFQNLSGYDGHPLALELSKYATNGRELKPIAKSKENYIGLQFGCLRFIDSLRFFQKSLDGVAESMGDTDFIEQIKTLEDYIKSLNDDDLISLKTLIPKDLITTKKLLMEGLKLLRRKGIYPYDWVDSFEKYDEKQPPPIEAFYSKLYKKGISEKDYEHVLLVWKAFNCQTFGDYTDLYMKTDVMLLADAFEKFRKFFLEHHQIDPCHTYSAPALTWQCGLKYCGKVWDGCYDIIHKTPIEELSEMRIQFEKLSRDGRYMNSLSTKHNVPVKSISKLKSILGGESDEHLLHVKANPKKYKFGLELLIDKDMLFMFEGGIRGGYSGLLGNRFVKANNKYIPDFNKDLETNFLLYLDANNLYGWAMSQLLPYNDFMWIKHDYIDDVGEHVKIDKQILLNDQNFMKNRGLIYELDLEYTDEAKKKTYKFPLAVENKKVDINDLSPLQRKLQEQSKIPLGNKLICDLKDKEHYIVYGDNLKFYLSQGMQIKKIHRIVAFKQEAWLEPYIDFNTQQRTKAKTEFEKDIWKLMNNAFYGKTMENIRTRVDVRLVTDDHTAKKLHSRLNYHSETIFSEHLTAIQMSKEKIYFNKPIYIGMVVLELSKLLMYRTFYNQILPRWSKAEIIGFDTDSFFLNIYADDVYKDMEGIKDTLDTSEYSKDHPLYSLTNKKVIGKFKDELMGEIMTVLRFSRSKQYEFEVLPTERAKKLKEKGFGFKLSDKYEAIKLKGVPKVAIYTNQITGIDFHEAITNPDSTSKYIEACLLRSKLHENYMIEIRKKALSSYDDKRWIADDGIKTRPFGWESIEDIYTSN